MNREEIILSCEDIVDNLIKKYNNHKLDEDLHSIGMISVIQCVDKCAEENITDINQIQARCNIWARNNILKEIYKQKYLLEGDDIFADITAPDDMTETMVSLENMLTPRQKEVFDLLLQGYTKDEIMKKLNIKHAVYYYHEASIKKKIKSLMQKN